MVEKRKLLGQRCDTFTDGESVMRWWLNENPNQVTLNDILEQEED